MASAVEDSDSTVRLRFQIEDGTAAPVTLQVLVKSRRTAAATELLYQILWPTERKGEGLLLTQPAGGSLSGHALVPPGRIARLAAGDADEPVFDSHLTLSDLTGNFFRWPSQAIVGTETVDRVECVMLESKGGSGRGSPHERVLSWIDPERLVPLRIEKFDRANRLLRVIETTRVTRDEDGGFIPATLIVTSPGRPGSTEVAGSKLRRDITLTDSDFAPTALETISLPR